MLICFRRPVECIKFALFVVVVIVVLSLNFACMRKELVRAQCCHLYASGKAFFGNKSAGKAWRCGEFF